MQDEQANAFGRMLTDPRIGVLMQLVIHLGHFNYAMDQLRNPPVAGRATSAPHGFFSDAVLRRIGDWFSEPPGTPDAMIDRALTDAGMDIGTVDDVDHLLDQPIGTTCWRRFIKDYRNGASSHNVFNRDVQREILERYEVEPTSWETTFEEFIDEFAPTMDVLQKRVESALRQYDEHVYSLLWSSARFPFTTPLQ